MVAWVGALKILKKSVPNGQYYLQRAVTPDQITQQNSLQRAGGALNEIKAL
jgi:hypothetical protein